MKFDNVKSIQFQVDKEPLAKHILKHHQVQHPLQPERTTDHDLAGRIQIKITNEATGVSNVGFFDIRYLQWGFKWAVSKLDANTFEFKNPVTIEISDRGYGEFFKVQVVTKSPAELEAEYFDTYPNRHKVTFDEPTMEFEADNVSAFRACPKFFEWLFGKIQEQNNGQLTVPMKYGFQLTGLTSDKGLTLRCDGTLHGHNLSVADVNKLVKSNRADSEGWYYFTSPQNLRITNQELVGTAIFEVDCT